MSPASLQKMASGITYMPEALTTSDPYAVVSINLHSNKIAQIEGLHVFTHLRHLNLSSNRIESVMGLNGLVNLESLNLSTNRISVAAGLDDLINLKKLLLSYNEISSLVGLGQDAFQSTNPCLHTLELHGNNVADFDQLHFLEHLHSLRVLSLRSESHSNPVCRFPNYGDRTRQILPQISVLDSGSPIVNTPRIDNALQIARSRSRHTPDNSISSLEHLVQDARIESLESKLDVFMTMQALANRQAHPDVIPGEPAPPASKRASSPGRLEHRDAWTVIDHEIGRTNIAVVTDPVGIGHKDALVGPDRSVESKDVQVLTDPRIPQTDASVATEDRPELRNAEMLTDEDERLAKMRIDLKASESRFAEVENTLRTQLATAHDFIKESVKQSREAMAQMKKLKENEVVLSTELQSSKNLVEKLRRTINEQNEGDNERLLEVRSLRQKEAALCKELEESKLAIEKLHIHSNQMERRYEEELSQLKKHQFDLESNCQKLSQDRAALKELTRSALQKQKQLSREIEAYKHCKGCRENERKSALESHNLVVQDLKRNIDTCNCQIEMLNQKESSLKEELLAAKSTTERQSIQISSLSERLKLAAEENHDLQSQLQHLKESGITSMKILEDHSMHIKELKSVIRELNKEKNEWKHVEDSLCQRVEDYRARCHDAENSLQDCQEVIDSSRAERRELECAMNHLQKEIEQRDRARCSSEDELKNVKLRCDETVASFSREITTLKAKLQELESAAIDSQSKRKAAEALVAEVNQQRDAALLRANQVEKQMRMLLNEHEIKRKEMIRFAKSWASG